MNREFFENPETFDGFRYYRLRTASQEARNSHQMVTVGKKDLTWGYGRHACPGRYIAEVALKLLAIEFLTRYDIRLPDNVKERQKNIEFEGLVSRSGYLLYGRSCQFANLTQIIPDPEWELTMNSR
jgi:cytochrome P450